ncbi:uncharacterized protein K452DRAFT_303516 [Aplosporella prunicola CBS 121167]|uniref:Uncharacterized protein n=1 Tax=Aplosporella prunicola CBS 121167 TaxID=1176127 RepID=A0A6A6AW39_9PEZI|nr:uncharacterized protein K452DRAFT_303516 [Aplosporella prunicola CBS 121167]KAF2135468.1 hypothetical protein K452DRAFT_303516 [Aplosporella prunicola CBS 121167]
MAAEDAPTPPTTPKKRARKALVKNEKKDANTTANTNGEATTNDNDNENEKGSKASATPISPYHPQEKAYA